VSARLTVSDVLKRDVPPAPWAEGEKIPWHEPGFSVRMLAEHLSQSHDMASRRAERIDAHVSWIHGRVLGGRTARVLDLGCGPGLYTERLAILGCECVGIDFGPASVEYAQAEARAKALPCTYRLGDIRKVDYAGPYDLVMLIFGELNVFRPSDAECILGKAHAALSPGGLLLLEPQTFDAVRSTGRQAASWSSFGEGLWSDRPHLVLEESFWDENAAVATTRYFVIDAATGDVSRYASSVQAYTDDELRSLLTACGFADVRLFPSLSGGEDHRQPELFAVTAVKGG